MNIESLTISQASVLFGGGLLAGIVNVLAGGGSFLTLPLLMWTGLGPQFANATNRVAIMVQNIAAVSSYRRRGFKAEHNHPFALLPLLSGSLLGAVISTLLDKSQFSKSLAIILGTLTLFMLLRPSFLKPGELGHERPKAIVALAFFLVGLYGGFIQAGVGIFVLIAAHGTLAIPLIRANSIKIEWVTWLTIPALLWFIYDGSIDISRGLVLGLGNIIGSLIGVRLSVGAALKWVRPLVILVCGSTAVKLWLSAG